MATSSLPTLPVPHTDLVEYIAQNTEKPLVDIIDPYRKYETHLRTVYAQDRQNPVLDDPYINVVPLFTEKTKLITTRARDLASESEEEKSKYIMALPDDKRRPHGSPATVSDMAEFQKNFNVFSETSLAEIDWSNVVAAGSSVVNCLLPVPPEFKTNKRKLREYYHEKFCPASDVDLFLYGLTHDQAIEKIKQIEQAVRDALLNEITVVRTKYAITIASQHPVRHIQVVLRVYKSVSEILTGFDIDAAGGAFDGKQVWVTPRALGSFISQVNHIDLTRRSPSYENRLSKYSHRNFEVYWPELDRSRIDPTIFERSFGRTLGLARLLILERLPTHSTREAYLNKRRKERGRPTNYRGRPHLRGNLKDTHEDEISDWLSEEDVSNYHTFTVPYGQQFNAKRIEKLCYTKDLLLNAEWNQPDKREVYLHRHPAFFGRVQDVIEDCCGSCPQPTTAEEIEVAEKEAEIYISGKVSFLIDDPGRQQIGSFNPLTEQDWTDMAYVGNTARLCQSIVEGDVDDVLNWLSQDGADPNQRDYTGRSPLHLAVMCSTPEVVKCLVDHGSRLTARLADGKTALHLAAWRGNAEMIRILMEKSIMNEELEMEKQAKKRQANRTSSTQKDGLKKGGNSTEIGNDIEDADADADHGDEDDSDGEMIDVTESAVDTQSIVTGSFVNVKGENNKTDDLVPEESEDDPDYYQIDVLAWDVPCSPLHLAISEGHEDAVELLCDYGADALLPIKFSDADNDETAAILTLVLVLSLPTNKAKSMARLLLKLGATCSQAESNGATALHRYIASGNSTLINILLESDKIGLKSAINHVFVNGLYWNAEVIAPLHSAVMLDNSELVRTLLEAGARAHVDFETWLKAARLNERFSRRLGTLEANKSFCDQSLEQPLITAIRQGYCQVATELLEHGADANTLTLDSQKLLHNYYDRSNYKGRSALDSVRDLVDGLLKRKGKIQEQKVRTKPQKIPGIDTYLQKFTPGTYQHWVVEQHIFEQGEIFEKSLKNYNDETQRAKALGGSTELEQTIEELIAGLRSLETLLLAKGAKTFAELHPDIKTKDSDFWVEGYPRYSGLEEAPKPYEYHFNFVKDKDTTETRREGYIQLMEAAWNGDLNKIQELTLHAWGPNQDQSPLMMAISDGDQNSPLSLSFCRGHYLTAQAILEIVKAQWSPPEKLKYKIEDDDVGTEDEYSSNDDDDDKEPRIVSTKADKSFTIDNIGQISLQVESHTKPLAHLCEKFRTFKLQDGKTLTSNGGLFEHVFWKDDLEGLKVLVDMALQYSTSKSDDDAVMDYRESFDFPQHAFLYAIQHEKLGLLKYAIKRTGAGVPLDHLVKKSGVELKVKPKYYMGLTVYGKKRKDWANAGRNMAVKTSGLETPPLLHAALAGSLESVEFFLGDAPHRLYSEFGKSKLSREDVRFKHLKDSPGGFDRSISKWLGAENDYVIHCAILGGASKRSSELLEYLIEMYPESLEKKTTNGDTPLMIACRLGHISHTKILIDAGADQSTRNARGENIVHAALTGAPSAHRLRLLLDLLDADLRNHLFQQRKNLQADGLTPLHDWISLGDQRHRANHFNSGINGYQPARMFSSTSPNDDVDVLRLLLEYSKGSELQLLSGVGETPLHTVIQQRLLGLAKVLIDFQPQLLYRENAVGRTPAELAQELVSAQHMQKPSDIPSVTRRFRINAMINEAWDSAVKEDSNLSPDEMKQLAVELGLSGEYTSSELLGISRAMGLKKEKRGEVIPESLKKLVIWDLCRTAIEKSSESRRLVTLNEANDVAKRLGETFTSSRYFSINAHGDDEDDGAEGQEAQETIDFTTRTLRDKVSQAWQSVSKSAAEELGLEKCDECNEYHE